MLIDPPLCRSYSFLNGGPTVMITTRSADGVDDVMANAWNTLFEMGTAPQVIVVFETTHTSYRNILETGEFGISVPGTALRGQLIASGSVHGRDVGDKFVHLGIGKLASRKIKAPLVEGALAHLECRLLERDLFEKKGIALAEVLDARVEADYWNGDSIVTEGRPQKTMHSAGSTTWFARGEVCDWSQDL